MSIVSRFFSGVARGRSVARARALERAGDLAAASLAFEQAGAPDEALRLALALADTEADTRARVRQLGRAARLATAERAGELGLRYARARLDLATSAPGGVRLKGELEGLAREFEAYGDHTRAAVAYRLAGDREGEARALTEAGALDELEGVLHAEGEVARRARERVARLATARDLDAAGRRIEALALVERGLEGDDARALATSIRARLCRPGALVAIDEDGVLARWAFGDEVLLGRGAGCVILVAAPTLSRRHLRFVRTPSGEPAVIDAGTDNGTTLVAGGRLGHERPFVVRGPLELRAAEVPVRVAPHPGGGLAVEVAGEPFRVPLGSAPLGPWRVEAGAAGVQLRVPEGAPTPLLGRTLVSREGVDLCVGDELSEARGAEPRVRVLA